MLKRLLGLLLCLMTIMPACYAGGGTVHMYIAQEAIKYIPDARLRNLLLDNLDAYLVGAYYPDSGFVKGNHYGDDTHKDRFINTFADYVNGKYIDPVTQNPKLVAFLFGCAAHQVGDHNIHNSLYPYVKKNDFPGDARKAHKYGDTGIDLLAIVDKNLWFRQPSVWWVPVNDLLAIYHRMNADQYTANDIIWGNTVLSFAGTGERLISAEAYLPLRWKMPWTAKHYYDWPKGGLLMTEMSISQYHINLWNRVFNNKVNKINDNTMLQDDHLNSRGVYDNDEGSPIMSFAEKALKDGLITITTKTNDDGSVEFGRPVINHMSKLHALIKEYLGDFL